MASYKQVILLLDYWSHLLRTISTRLHVGISARSSIVMSCAHLPKYKVKKIMTFHYNKKNDIEEYSYDAPTPHHCL